MIRINPHVWPGGIGVRCSVCGSVRRDDSKAGTPLGCIDRLVSDPASVRSTIMACEDSEVIMAKIAELRGERETAYTRPVPEPSSPERPIGRGGLWHLIDYRDCRVG